MIRAMRQVVPSARPSCLAISKNSLSTCLKTTKIDSYFRWSQKAGFNRYWFFEFQHLFKRYKMLIWIMIYMMYIPTFFYSLASVPSFQCLSSLNKPLTEVLLTKFSSLITSMTVKDSKKSILRPFSNTSINITNIIAANFENVHINY